MKKAAKASFFIGAKLWLFDRDHRVYTPGGNDGPIYREYWIARYIVGEEKRSWLVSDFEDGKYARKMMKSTAAIILKTETQVEDYCWLNSNRQRLADAVGRCTDVAVLRRVANIVEYAP